MTNQPAINFDQIIRRVALNVEAISNGTNPSELPMHINYNKQITINMNTANQIGFPIRNSWLVKVNLIESKGEPTVETGYTMVDLMKGVVQSNLALQAEKQNVKLSVQEVKSSKSQFLPDVSLNTTGTYIDPELAKVSNGQNPELSTSGDLTFSQVIYSEEAAANIDIQKNLLASQKENYNASELDAMMDAAIAYYNTLVYKSNLSIQNNNLQMTKRNLEIATQNLELGASGKSDVLRFKSQMAQNTQSMIEARNTLSQAFHQLNQLLNQEIGTPIDVIDNTKEIAEKESDNYAYLMQTLDDPKQQKTLTKFFIEEAKRNAPELKNIGHNMAANKRLYELYN
jgi:outer membrane protein TolC